MGGHPRRIITISLIIIIITITFSIKIIIIIIIFLPREIMWVVSTRVVDASALQAAPSVAKKECFIFFLFPSYFFMQAAPSVTKRLFQFLLFCFITFSHMLLLGVEMLQPQVIEICFRFHFSYKVLFAIFLWEEYSTSLAKN